MYFTWPGVVYDILPCYDSREIYLSPLDRAAWGELAGWPSSYAYSTSFVGHPQLWSGSALPEKRFKVAQRISSVLLPSAKAMLWDEGGLEQDSTRHGPRDSIPFATLAADCSARSWTYAETSEPTTNPFEDSPVRYRKLHNTSLGVLGADLK